MGVREVDWINISILDMTHLANCPPGRFFVEIVGQAVYLHNYLDTLGILYKEGVWIRGWIPAQNTLTHSVKRAIN